MLEADGLADLGIWKEAWEALEALPPVGRATIAALRIRLRCCAGLRLWDLGSDLAARFSEGAASVLASKLHLDHARHLLRSGDRPGAIDAIGKAIDACPRAR